MKSKVVLVAFLLMLYIAPMIFISSYGHGAIPAQPNMNKDFLLASDPWLEGWDKRQKITINGSAGAGTNYSVRVDVQWGFEYLLEYSLSWADSAHQGITVDGVYVYTTNSTGITKYLKDGTFVSSHDCNGDGTYDTIGDLFYYGGFLYVLAHSGGSPWHSKAMKYTTALVYSDEFSITDFVNPTGAGNNIAYGNSSFWVMEGWEGAVESEIEIQRYDLGWSFQENWTLANFEMSGSYGYQGFDWIDANSLIAVPHEGMVPDTVDFYIFDGEDFYQNMRVDRPEWSGEDSSTYEACQGVAVEVDGDDTYIWFASRNNTAVTQLGEIGKYLLSDLGGLGGKCQQDFEDIRFTESDKTTELSYWLEEFTSGGIATFWIKISDDLDSDTVIYLYYGTSEESETTSDGWDTFLFYEDWETESIQAEFWDILATDGSVSWSETDANHGSVLRLEGNAGNFRYQFSSDFANGYEWSAGVACRMRSKMEKTIEPSQIVQVGFQEATAKVQFKSYQGDYYAVLLVDDDGNEDSTSLAFDYWDSYYTYEATRNGTYVELWIDNNFIAEGNNAPDENEQVINFYVRDSEKDLYNDWIIVRKFISNEPEPWAFGDEETALPPDWVDVGTAIISFVVPLFTGSLDALLIFLGLVMIPASTLYLVKGGKDEMSSNKLFYGLIAFIMGWALFLGGIMP